MAKQKSQYKNFPVFLMSCLLVLFLFGIVFFSCSEPAHEKEFRSKKSQEAEIYSNNSTASIDQLLNSTFRIDIKEIEVVFDYFPEEWRVNCRSFVRFVMREGQKRPVIHLDPAINSSDSVQEIKLDNENLDFFDESDVKILSYLETTQRAIEFQRDLDENEEHVLEMSYNLELPVGYPRFSTELNDIHGRGNEEIFPTLNTPHELAHHTITFNVYSPKEFRCIGSGHVEKSVGEQQWTLDTEREVSSYTVMFVLMPAEDTVYETREIAGIDVRIMAYKGGASVSSGFSILESWLPELITNLGPFPMPWGLSIFLASYGGGMEFYGGTITSIWALKHEVFHMYFGCSTVNRTYRDTWMDEAINEWYEKSADSSFSSIWDNYSSNIVSGRSPVAVGFDRRAYDEGARIMQAVSQKLGGRTEMVGFLYYLNLNYSFAPFTTLDFLAYLKDYSGLDMEDEFIRWLYSDSQVYSLYSILSAGEADKMMIDMTPPRMLQEKYGLGKSGKESR